MTSRSKHPGATILPGVVAALALAALPYCASAELATEAPQEFTAQVAQSGGPPARQVGFSLEGGAFYQSRTDLKDSPGSFSASRVFLSVGGEYRFDFRNAVSLSFGGGYTEYNFNDATGLSNGDPWNRVEDYRIAVPVRFAPSDRTQVFIVPTVRWEAETDANLADGRTYGAVGGISWKVNESLSIGPGIGVFSRLRGGTRVFGILLIDWSITDRLSLTTGGGLGATQGPGLTLDYKVNDDWTVGIAGRYENSEFRLDDKGVAPGGIGRDRVFPVVATVAWSPNPAIRLSGFAGVELGGKLSLLDENGVTLQESDYDPAPIVGGIFNFRF